MMTELMDTRSALPDGERLLTQRRPYPSSAGKRTCPNRNHMTRATGENAPATERLEKALAFAAYLVELHGPKMVPIFECMERELAAKKAEVNAMDRAKRLLENRKVTS
jgi:hypothetical protein